MTTPTITPVRRDVTVPASVERAFQIFTTHFDSWWPRAHHIGSAELRLAVLEPRVGGRWYEIGIDGRECDWGRVLSWDEPDRVVLAWHLNGQFQYDPDPARASEVEVSFRPSGAAATIVTLEHRCLERHVEGEAVQRGVDSEGGWGGILKGYAVLIASSAR